VVTSHCTSAARIFSLYLEDFHTHTHATHIAAHRAWRAALAARALELSALAAAPASQA